MSWAYVCQMSLGTEFQLSNSKPASPLQSPQPLQIIGFTTGKKHIKLNE